MDIQLVIFDCFGVIVDESAPVWLNKHFAPDEADRLNKTVVRNGDLGRATGQETFALMGEKVGKTPAEVCNEWLSLAKRHENTYNTILNLRKTYKTALLSNAIDGLIQGLFTSDELNALFDYTVVSCQVGFAKPDKEIYELLLQKSGIAPEHAVFIDDNPANLLPARALGMHTIVYHSFEQFEGELQALLTR